MERYPKLKVFWWRLREFTADEAARLQRVKSGLTQRRNLIEGISRRRDIEKIPVHSANTLLAILTMVAERTR